MRFVIQNISITCYSFRGKELHCDSAMLSPFVVVLRCRDCASVEDSLIFHEILFPRRKDCAVVNKEFSGNSLIRDHDKELVSHPDRIERAVFLCPSMQCAFGILAKERIANWRARWNYMTIFIFEILAEDKRDTVRYSQNDSQVQEDL